MVYISIVHSVIQIELNLVFSFTNDENDEDALKVDPYLYTILDVS